MPFLCIFHLLSDWYNWRRKAKFMCISTTFCLPLCNPMLEGAFLSTFRWFWYPIWYLCCQSLVFSGFSCKVRVGKEKKGGGGGKIEGKFWYLSLFPDARTNWDSWEVKVLLLFERERESISEEERKRELNCGLNWERGHENLIGGSGYLYSVFFCSPFDAIDRTRSSSFQLEGKFPNLRYLVEKFACCSGILCLFFYLFYMGL